CLAIIAGLSVLTRNVEGKSDRVYIADDHRASVVHLNLPTESLPGLAEKQAVTVLILGEIPSDLVSKLSVSEGSVLPDAIFKDITGGPEGVSVVVQPPKDPVGYALEALSAAHAGNGTNINGDLDALQDVIGRIVHDGEERHILETTLKGIRLERDTANRQKEL